MNTVVIDGKMLTEKAQLQEYLSGQPGFPFYYGRNLDALYDALTSMGEPTKILVRHRQQLELNLGRYSAALLRVLERAAQQNPNVRLAFSEEAEALEVVAALIWEKGRFLICQRPAHKNLGLFWEFAGGKVEAGETHRQALARECKEELDIDLWVGDLFMDVAHSYPEFRVHLFLYHARISGGTPRAIEHNDLAWIAVQDIPKYSFCPADAEILERLKEAGPPSFVDTSGRPW